ncbi:MAG: hypothetical protein ACE5JR_03545 [Gemmatimonadota bacterium]
MTDGKATRFELDVFVQGSGVRRGVGVEVGDGRLVSGDINVPFSSVFWMGRRAGLLLLFARHTSVALKGDGRQLDAVARTIVEAVDATEWRRQLFRYLGSEVVLFAAECAVAGTVVGEPVRGLCVAAFTKRGAHLFSGERQWSIGWPAEVAETRTGRANGGGEALFLKRGDVSLSLLYLHPEEIESVLKVALAPPEEEPEEFLELFTRGQVAPPPPPRLPEFSLAAGSLQAIAEEAAARVPRDLQTRAELGAYFFETHFLELGEIALGPLLLRKSAASSARGLGRAVRAMSADDMQRDTQAAVATAADRLAAVYDHELERLLRERKVPFRLERELVLSQSEFDDIGTRMQLPFDRLSELFGELAGQEAELVDRLAALDEGPPGAAEEVVEETATEWRATLERLDRAYELAWRELVTEIEGTWSGLLLPRLARVGALRTRRFPEWVQLAIIAAITVLVVAALGIVLFA